jgi:Cu/Ag efflux protein CusF
MGLSRAIILMSLALMVGVALGYVRWGREARQLRESLAQTAELVPRPAVGDSGRWSARGVVRNVLRDQNVVFLTHEAIPGVMAERTRAFTAVSPTLLTGLSPGDSVRFALERRRGQIVLVAIERDNAASTAPGDSPGRQ